MTTSPYKAWESHWNALPSDMVELFTTGTPRSLHEFWARCYFEDLWRTMGERAARANYLELGSGRGTTSLYLASRGCRVTLVDLAPTAFEIARANFARHRLAPPSTVLADVRNTGLASRSFDCVFSIGLLEHFEEPLPVLEETVRLLAAGGISYSVIITHGRKYSHLACDALFAPWRLARYLLPRTLIESLRMPHRPQVQLAADPVVRNTLGEADYLARLRDMPVSDVRFVPYNPYHSVYDSRFWEELLVIPSYRAYSRVKAALGVCPVLATSGRLACCDLLTFRRDV